ncbi:MAG: sensor histidine kinase [Xanthobacteraceae bacterium]
MAEANGGCRHLAMSYRRRGPLKNPKPEQITTRPDFKILEGNKVPIPIMPKGSVMFRSETRTAAAGPYPLRSLFANRLSKFEAAGTAMNVNAHAGHPTVAQRQAELEHTTRMLTLGELAASIVHEVNQPLAAIVTNGETCLRWLSRDEPQLDKARASLGKIIRDALRSSDIIRQLRSLARKAEVEKAELSVNDLIREAIPLLDSEMEQYGVSVRLNLEPDLPPVLGDRIQLQQVAINLFVNAMHAMSSVTGRRHELTVRTRLQITDEIVVAVEDNGPGIDPENLDRLFMPFFTTKQDGMGLGLAICQSIIEAHGGRIWATRNSVRGATFHFALPAQISEPQEHAQVSAAIRMPGRRRKSSSRSISLLGSETRTR